MLSHVLLAYVITLATAFFLLYTSLCRDLNGRPPATPPRWSHGGEEVVIRSAAVDQEARTKEHEEVARREGERTKKVTSSDGGAEERTKQGIVMPAAARKQVSEPSSASFVYLAIARQGESFVLCNLYTVYTNSYPYILPF
jgi:hypothetical protein